VNRKGFRNLATLCSLLTELLVLFSALSYRSWTLTKYAHRGEGGNLGPHIVWVRGTGLTQTCSPGLLLFGAGGYQKNRLGGHLGL